MFLFLLLLGSAVGVEFLTNRIHLSQIKTITLTDGQQTNSRRVPSVPQLECVGVNCDAPKASHPQHMQCTTTGSDGRDMQWKCTAELAKGYNLGRTDVSCEGYDHSNDEHVLVGSCGVQYDLIKVVEQPIACKPGPMGPPGIPGPMGPRGFDGEDAKLDPKIVADMVAAVTRPIICLSVFASLCATALLIACCYSSSSTRATTADRHDRIPDTRRVYESIPHPPTVIVRDAPQIPTVIHCAAEPVHHHVRVHRTPATVYEPAYVPDYTPATVYESDSPEPVRRRSPDRHTSTGYGTTTKRRSPERHTSTGYGTTKRR